MVNSDEIIPKKNYVEPLVKGLTCKAIHLTSKSIFNLHRKLASRKQYSS